MMHVPPSNTSRGKTNELLFHVKFFSPAKMSIPYPKMNDHIRNIGLVTGPIERRLRNNRRIAAENQNVTVSCFWWYFTYAMID